MNEKDLNEALHDVIARNSPPPMDPARALEVARGARKRRRGAWAGAAVVTLVVGIGAGPAVVANYTDGGSVDQLVASGAGTTQPVSTPLPVSTMVPATPTTRTTEDPWPEGQTDRTATTGPRAVRAVTLMNELSSSVPPGFTTPDLKYPDGRKMRWPQAQYASSEGEQDYWEYLAAIPVRKDDGVGRLLVQSTTPNGKPAMDPCKLVLAGVWDGTGPCTIVNVGGTGVGVVTIAAGGSFDQWAATGTTTAPSCAWHRPGRSTTRNARR
jgi:hypothetical protein